MFIFQIFINVIEVLLFSTFLSYFFDVYNKKRFFITLSLVNIFVLNIGVFDNAISPFLYVILILTSIALLSNHCREKTLSIVFVPIIYCALTLIANILAPYIIASIYFTDVSMLKFYDKAIYFSDILSKVFQICLIPLLYKLKTHSLSLLLKKWWFIAVAEIIFIIIICLCWFALSVSPALSSTTILFIIIVNIIILNIIFIYSLYKTNKINNENTENEKALHQLELRTQNNAMISHIKRETDYLNHRMYYILWLIEKYADSNDTTKIKDVVLQYKDILSKRPISVKTNNDVFDYVISSLLTRFIENHINLKYTISITEKEFYNDINFINYISELLNHYLIENISLDIHINEYNNYLLITIMSNCEDLFSSNLNDSLTRITDKYKAYVHKAQIEDIIEIKLSIPIN